MKTLKNLFHAMAAVLLLALTATVAVSCGDDDDDPVAEKKLQKVQITVNANPTADMLKYLDLAFVYEDSNGGSETKKIDTTEPKFSFDVTKFPATASINYTMKQKSGVELPTEGSISVSAGFYYTVTKYFSDGTSSLLQYAGSSSSLSVGVDKFASWIEKHIDNKNSFEFDSNGDLK
ncbi:MAG: Vmc-like lipoprotein signal peptide domain-containing protein [Prevotella sp.]